MPRVSVIIPAHNAAAYVLEAPARNRALAQASGELVVSLDADDLLKPRCARQGVT